MHFVPTSELEVAVTDLHARSRSIHMRETSRLYHYT